MKKRKYKVVVNVLNVHICQHIVRTISQDKAAERIMRAYPKQPYQILSVKELREHLA